jgi:hypothetical protein
MNVRVYIRRQIVLTETFIRFMLLTLNRALFTSIASNCQLATPYCVIEESLTRS